MRGTFPATLGSAAEVPGEFYLEKSPTASHGHESKRPRQAELKKYSTRASADRDHDSSMEEMSNVTGRNTNTPCNSRYPLRLRIPHAFTAFFRRGADAMLDRSRRPPVVRITRERAAAGEGFGSPQSPVLGCVRHELAVSPWSLAPSFLVVGLALCKKSSSSGSSSRGNGRARYLVSKYH